MYAFARNNSIVHVDPLGRLCLPFTTRRVNEQYSPPKNSVAWEFDYMMFTDQVQGDGAGSGVGVFLSYTCHYKRTLNLTFDKQRCNCLFQWVPNGSGSEKEPDTKSETHDLGLAVTVNSGSDYAEFRQKCQEQTPSP